MGFVKLNHPILMKLKMQGYTILRSNNPLSDENPTWIPEKVDMEKFFDLDSKWIAHASIPMHELHLLVIDDALYNIRNVDLFGEVIVR
ncbi:hypothetical protein [Sphingobacterium bovistauri]|uniref:Uncharacterized protein n=1 Tax=Sphingobacterium bovistauri TaxID=2781959 RepID=A0ABS7Z7I0_9SPHI|nr:hypothetical protein [Sphingobacterium bovistauri]MCA5006110.1 hypothetical protein [Sphingobacterium bovistauri]